MNVDDIRIAGEEAHSGTYVELMKQFDLERPAPFLDQVTVHSA